ncbi:hypothetical protein HB779_22880 (plasmid) [Phyllobacterium sp. 628]|uniref:hypothetical protein n=1 Tax=Phyllobacterium sp. 628 TaxID=2718938 RepID=UPI00166259DC|nr:hypothetical protein [Phyllobacterium sp. 628]QND54756.1 hypothetical protein HB779_22880 [Phyllobacterium sp. 628]
MKIAGHGNRSEMAGLVEFVCQKMSCNERTLAQNLELPISAIRMWKIRPAPRFVILALCALVENLNADKLMATEHQHQKDGDRGFQNFLRT